MRTESRGDVQRRASFSVGAALEVHRIREVSASFDPIVSDDVSAIKRVRGGKSRRFESIRAGHGHGPTENVSEVFVGGRHCGRVFANDGITGQCLCE